MRARPLPQLQRTRGGASVVRRASRVTRGAAGRVGSFEVVRVDTGAVLWSKLAGGGHLVDGKTTGDAALPPFLRDVLGPIAAEAA